MKPRADITFREFKAGCKRNATNGSEVCRTCEQKPICDQIVVMEKAPAYWDLTDPPRFNEAQMAFWRGWYAIGMRYATLTNDKTVLRVSVSMDCDSSALIFPINLKTGLEAGKTLDLAELLGKDGAE